MPPTKRTLADADPNASSGPAKARNASKRAKASGKENEALLDSIIERVVEKYRANGKLAKDAKLSKEDIDALKKNITDASPDLASTNATASKSTSAQPSYSGWATGSSTQVQATNNGLKYITLPRPGFDRRQRRDEDDEDEDDDGEDTTENDKPSKEDLIAEHEKYWHKPAAEFPNHKWVISTVAWALYANMDLASQKCSPDAAGMYIYNDFEGYGLQEIIENALVAWNDEFSKKPDQKNALKMWAHIEALGWWFNMGEPDIWLHIDDGERVGKTTTLLGLALLETLHRLETVGLLPAYKEKVRNLPLVLSLWLRWLVPNAEDAMDCCDWDVAQSWPYYVVAYSNKCNISIKEGVNGIDKILKDWPEDDMEGKEKKLVYKAPHAKDADGKFGFKAKQYLTEYGRTRGGKRTAGGTDFDITKMSKAERKKHSFEGNDPLQGAPPVPAPERVPWEEL